ncbi:MAG TPA: NAD-dependent deacylase [Melioribacteraceae bacterium]|nr:NAD-dependent deacylase [Melioribacteraceae bacterium]
MFINNSLINKIINAKEIVFFTGAGISAESGIPTFRGKDGIWNKLKPEELANFNAFLKNPDMVWEWYQYRRQIIEEKQPNAGHYAIVEFENLFNNVTVITQNVDNLHNRAGSKKVLELHGNIEKNFCIKCKTRYDNLLISENKTAPKCKICGGLVRPDVVWFGEMLPQDVFNNAEKMAMRSDVCFVIGTSAVVYPAANIPIIAKQYGSLLIEINITNTELSHYCDYSLIGNSGEILPNILNEIKKLKNI